MNNEFKKMYDEIINCICEYKKEILSNSSEYHSLNIDGYICCDSRKFMKFDIDPTIFYLDKKEMTLSEFAELKNVLKERIREIMRRFDVNFIKIESFRGLEPLLYNYNISIILDRDSWPHFLTYNE